LSKKLLFHRQITDILFWRNNLAYETGNFPGFSFSASNHFLGDRPDINPILTRYRPDTTTALLRFYHEALTKGLYRQEYLNCLHILALLFLRKNWIYTTHQKNNRPKHLRRLFSF